MVGKVVGLGFEIISKLDSYSLMTVIVSKKNSKLILQIQCVIETAVECKVTLYKNLGKMIPTLNLMGKPDMTQPVI